MYFGDYLIFLVAILACFVFSLIASTKVKSAFNKHNKKICHSGMTGSEAAEWLMRANGVRDIGIGKTGGTLTDHYHPTKKIVNLSESTYASNSIAAVAVAAHEIGHVMQKKDSYWLYNLRTAVVPVANFGTFLAMPLVLLGLLLDYMVAATADSGIGFYLAMIGVALYGASFLFALVTLPVELDASRRAKKMLIEARILNENEIPAASEVLSAAALTYLASLLTSLVYFLRFLFYVLTLFGRRD